MSGVQARESYCSGFKQPACTCRDRLPLLGKRGRNFSSCTRIATRSRVQHALHPGRTVGDSQQSAAQQDVALLEAEVQTFSEPPSFDWTRHWYPVALVDSLDKETPNVVTLLNRDLVVWLGEARQWHTAEDRCPHRLAQLSSGRLTDGVLECRYHGWAFSGSGSCVSLPQAKPHIEDKAMRSSRTCLKTFPCQILSGLLWVWLQSGADGWLEASLHKPHLDREILDDHGFIGAGAPWSPGRHYTGWLLMTENAMDPSHAASLHDGVIGSRKDQAPMEMKLQNPIHPTEGVTLQHSGYTRQQQRDNMAATRTFRPPHYIKTDYKFEDGSRRVALLYIVPQKPGQTITFGKFMAKPAPGPAKKPRMGLKQRLRRAVLSRLLGPGVFHLAGHGLGDQDGLILHHLEANMASLAKEHRAQGAQKGNTALDWRKYRLATEADAGVTAFWRWLERYGHGDVAWSSGVTSADVPPRRETREELFDHYNLHTKHCSACLKALKRLEALNQALLVGMGALLVTAALFSGNRLAPRIAAAATICAMAFARSALGKLRQKFFSASTLPDEE